MSVVNNLDAIVLLMIRVGLFVLLSRWCLCCVVNNQDGVVLLTIRMMQNSSREMYSPIRRIKKMKNTSAFDTWSSSGVRRGIENKEEGKKKKTDKKLKQDNFQNLNINLKERHQNDEN